MTNHAAGPASRHHADDAPPPFGQGTDASRPVRKASLIAVHAWHTPQADMSRAGDQFTAEGRDFLQTEASRHLEALLDEWRAKYPDVPVSQDVVHGHPGRTLAGLSARTDLLVLGRHAAHHGSGAVTHAVLNHAHGPVATVPVS